MILYSDKTLIIHLEIRSANFAV